MELARIAARHCPTVTVEAPEVFTIRLGRRTLWIVKTTTRQSHRTDGIGACQSTEIIRLKALRIMIVIYKLPRPVVHGPTEVYPDEHTHLAIVALRQAMPWRRPADVSQSAESSHEYFIRSTFTRSIRSIRIARISNPNCSPHSAKTVLSEGNKWQQHRKHKVCKLSFSLFWLLWIDLTGVCHQKKRIL